MSAPDHTTGLRFRGSFTAKELDQLCGELRADALMGFLSVWNVLLTRAGQPALDQLPERTLRPDEYSIPFEQAKALVACLEPDNPELHFAWLLTWMDRGPTWHTD